MYSDQLFTLSDAELVDFINELKNPEDYSFQKNKLIPEINKRGWEISPIVCNDSGLLYLQNKVYLEQNTLFEQEVLLPSLVGRFYQIWRSAWNELIERPELKDKRLVTTVTNAKQSFLHEGRVRIVKAKKISKLKSKDVFIFMEVEGKLYPRIECLSLLKADHYVLFKRKPGYRYFGEFKVIELEK